MKTYTLCNRKWHIERFSGMPSTPPSPAMLLGTEVHHILEAYLTDGTALPAGRAGKIAAPGLRLLPKPGVGKVEGGIQVDYLKMSPPLKGFIDLYIPPEATEDGIPEVLDHKTTSAWRWAKTEEELSTDLQMIPYAAWAIEESRQNQVRVSHVQYLTKGAPEVRKVSTVLSSKHVMQEWNKLVGLVVEMKEASKIKSAKDVPPNPNACGAFGGCPFQDICGALQATSSPFAKIGGVTSATKKEKDMSRLQELLDRRRAEKKEPVPAAREQVEQVASGGITPPDASVTTAPAALASPAVESSPSQAPLVGNYTQGQYLEAASLIRNFMEAQGVSQVDRKAAAKIVGEVLGLKRVRKSYIEETVALSGGSLVCSEDGSVAKATTSSGETPTKKKASSKKTVLKKQEEPAQPEPPVKESPQGLRLFLDCYPIKGGEKTNLFEEVIAPFVEKVSKAHDVPVPLLLDYGRGKDEVAGLLKLALPTGDLVVSTKSPYWPAMSATLMAAADEIIKGSW